MSFHISEEPAIDYFEPRSSKYTRAPVVWAIDSDHLHNYLVPRECPRVTYYAGNQTTLTDIDRFLGSSPAVVAMESGWFDRLQLGGLVCYHLLPQSFECVDECAGYFVSRKPFIPTHVECFGDLITQLLKRGVELHFPPNLWPLRDAVVASSLKYSIIRMRKALPRPG